MNQGYDFEMHQDHGDQEFAVYFSVDGGQRQTFRQEGFWPSIGDLMVVPLREGAGQDRWPEWPDVTGHLDRELTSEVEIECLNYAAAVRQMALEPDDR